MKCYVHRVKYELRIRQAQYQIGLTKQITGRPARWARRMIALSMTAVMLALLDAGPIRAHTGPPIVVDTDMAADDARALAMLLNAPGLDVHAIVTSDGASPPEVGATNVCRILHFLNRDDIAVGAGRKRTAPPPSFRAEATGLEWSKIGEPQMPLAGLLDAAGLIRLALREEAEPVLYVCLGPLSNLADALEGAPELRARIQAVFWSGAPPGAPQPAWNARRDEEAFRTIAESGLRVIAVHWPEEGAAPIVDEALVDAMDAAESPAADLVSLLHRRGRGAELVRARRLRLADDLVAFCLLDPDIGKLSPVPGQPGWSEWIPADGDAVRGALLAALRQAPPRATVVLAEFPVEPQRLLPDVRESAARIIRRHGLEEWKATVLTSELHRHLGTYSIVGAKMGLRARERFNAALDELRVVSYAGSKPPLSCVNDGLQVATGASLGRGTIAVAAGAPPACEAVFSYGDRKIRLRLKAEYAARIAADMAELVKRHGGTTPAYFDDVRIVSLNHWLNFDRHAIFEEIEETPAKR